MGTATILVVEDERKIRDLVRSYLELEGYSVLVADSGERTLESCIGVRNCDHALDLWIRSGRRRRAGASLDGLRGERPPFLVALEARCLDRVRSRSAQVFSTSDSDSSPPVGGRGPHSGLRAKRFTPI
jgi:hypothetical protein